MCQPTDLRQLGKWSEGGWVSLTQWGLFGSDGWLMERWLRKRKLAVSIIYLGLFFFWTFPKLVAFVIQASQNIIFPYCVMQLLSYFRFIFPTLARQSGGQLQLLRWPRHLFCPSDPIWVLLCACQSHAYEEGGSGLYVVSFKCLIKVSTCCSQTPFPPFTMSFVQFAYIYNIIYIYIWWYIYTTYMVSVYERISFRFLQGFCFPCCRLLFVRFYTSLLAKCRLLSYCLPISICASCSISFFGSPLHLIHIFVTLIWPWTSCAAFCLHNPITLSDFQAQCEVDSMMSAENGFYCSGYMTAWGPVMIVMWMSCPSFKLLGTL